jgi:hypothetical protein
LSIGCILGSTNRHSLLKKKHVNWRIKQFLKYDIKISKKIITIQRKNHEN